MSLGLFRDFFKSFKTFHSICNMLCCYLCLACSEISTNFFRGLSFWKVINYHWICDVCFFLPYVVMLILTSISRFPYFLPCFCISIIALAVTIACIWLPVSIALFSWYDLYSSYTLMVSPFIFSAGDITYESWDKWYTWFICCGGSYGKAQQKGVWQESYKELALDVFDYSLLCVFTA